MRLIFLVYFIVLSSLVEAQFVPFSFWQKNVDDQDPCDDDPAVGTVCTGGALYLGILGDKKYMVTPSGCNDSPTPNCDGSVDTLKKIWSNVNSNISGVQNITNQSTASARQGEINTPVIVAVSNTGTAAEYCDNMDFGGYTDWFLPDKTELAFLYCRAEVDAHDVNHPAEDPNCTNVGGKTDEIKGFATGDVPAYWASTQYYVFLSGRAWTQFFNEGDARPSGRQLERSRDGEFFVRCIRKYD